MVLVVSRQSSVADEALVHGAKSCKAALKGCDSVIHLASCGHIMRDQVRNSLRAFRVSNVDRTIDLAKRAVDASVHRFVFMSMIKMNSEETALGYSYSLRPEHSNAPGDLYAISN